MGYSHYYYVSKEFDQESFEKVAADFKKMVTPLKHLGVTLADGYGENYPTISPKEIRFNGQAKCGHEEKDLGITWPSNTASGVCKDTVSTQLQEITKSQWFAGAQLETRVCGGDCSHETFALEQKLETSWTNEDNSTCNMEPQGQYRSYTDSDGTKSKNPANEIGKYFSCVKTAYKPYDLAVTVALVIAKYHLGESIVIHSDGTMDNWHEAMILCDHFLGYGKGFSLDDDTSVPLDNTDANALVVQYIKNKTEIASLQEKQEKLDEQNREKISDIEDRYYTTIAELKEQQRKETRKIRDETDSAEEKTNDTLEELSFTISHTERIIYHLKNSRKKLDVSYKGTARNYSERKLELLEEYSDECISLEMYLAENDRKVNKYGIVIVGKSKIGGHRDDPILKLPYEYGCDISCNHNNICVTPKYFKTIQDAKQYLSKQSIRTVLKKFFATYDGIKKEYDEANSKYEISDFEGVIREQFSKYWSNTAYRDSEKSKTAKKLDINTIIPSEMTFQQILSLVENYGQ